MDKEKCNQSDSVAAVIETTTIAVPVAPPVEEKKVKVAKKEKPVVDDVEAAKKPSPLRQLLPIGLFLVTFATVLSLLIIYMDTSGKLAPVCNRIPCALAKGLNTRSLDSSGSTKKRKRGEHTKHTVTIITL